MYLLYLLCSSGCLVYHWHADLLKTSKSVFIIYYFLWIDDCPMLIIPDWAQHWSWCKCLTLTWTQAWNPVLKLASSTLCVPTATAVFGLRHRHRPGSSSPLQCVRKGLCWMLLGQRSVLRMGRDVLYSLPAKHQEVWDTNTNDTRRMTIHFFEQETYLMFVMFYRRFRRQDVRNGDPNTLCSGGKIHCWL